MDSEILDYVYSLAREGIKLDLTVTREFSQHLGNPSDDYISFHMAGSNGKGSTSAYLYNIFQNKARTGLYTSPHLVDFNERIISGREKITDEYIEEFIKKYRPEIESLKITNRNPTFFELTTVMAFKFFQETDCRYASIEVGLGGRLDSTNIITPAVGVITQVGYEHALKLGCSLTSISFEKGGIIKNGVPTILGDRKPEVLSTIRRITESRNSKLLCSWEKAEASEVKHSFNGTKFNLATDKTVYRIETALTGSFQTNNIACAVLAAEESGENLLKRDIENGIKNTRWPGRMQVISHSPVVMLDSSHNPPAAHSLVSGYRALTDSEPLLLVGMLADKDSASYLRAIRKLSGRIVFTTPDEPERAVPAETLNSLYGSLFEETKVISDPISAYEYCLGTGSDVLVTGSMYLIGKIMKEKRIPVDFFPEKVEGH